MSNTAFISYGGDDEGFASKLNRALQSRGVKTWFFKNDAQPGDKLHQVMREAVNNHDRIVLICSKSALHRPGVNNEIEKVLEREAREGGSTRLIPVVIDDYLLVNWRPRSPTLKARRSEIVSRVAADFRGALGSGSRFCACVDKLASALSA